MSLVPFESAITAGEAIINKFIPDKTAQEAAKAQYNLAVLNAQTTADTDQATIDKQEAASPSLFIGGWRPAIGWVGALALFCYYVPYILSVESVWLWQAIHTGVLGPRPDLGISDLMGLIMSLLGMGTLRTVDKFTGNDTKGVAVAGVLSSILGKGKK